MNMVSVTTVRLRAPPIECRRHDITGMIQHSAGYDSIIQYIFYVIVTQGSPSGCGRCEIPGVTQVEKGNARDTAVTT